VVCNPVVPASIHLLPIKGPSSLLHPLYTLLLDVAWLCIHWVMQDTQQHALLIHADSVKAIYSFCVHLLFLE